MMYPKELEIFATGGTIGDALFMFCSGYTLFLGRIDRFDNWYKRRISRIYPSVIAWSFFLICIGKSIGVCDVILGAGRWFIPCIMIYYIFLYFVRKYLMKYKWTVFAISCIIPIIWFILFEDTNSYHMYRNHTFRYYYWFPFMLMGAFIGSKNIVFKKRGWYDAIVSLFCIGLHLAFLMACTMWQFLCPYQMLSLIPLMGACIFMYKMAQADIFKRLMTSKIGYGIQAIASLCLESYIVQYVLFTDKMNGIFPLNLVIVMIAVFMLAYIIRTCGRIFKQIFEKEEFRWNEIFQIV